MVRQVSTDRFTASRLRNSFWEFFQYFWPETAPEVLRPAWYTKLFCLELETIARRIYRGEPREYDLLWNCPPGATKSTVASVLFNCWVWSWYPQAKFLTGSYTERLALDLSRKTREVLQGEKYARLFPDVVLTGDQNTKGYYRNTRGGFRFATGVGGSATGMHTHFLVVDDPIDPQEALSIALLQEADLWIREVLSRRKVDLMLSTIIMVMQRLHEADPAGCLIDRKTPLRHFCIPADDSWEILPAELVKYYTNGLMDPVRFPRVALEEAQKTLLDVGYACQYGQKPVPRGGAKFNIEAFSLADAASTPSVWKSGPLRYWDKAATQRGGAFTVGVKGAIDKADNLWILGVERFQMNSGLRELYIQKTAEADGPGCIVMMEQEPAGSGKEAAETSQLALARLGFTTRLDRVTGDKELRADPLSIYVNQGKVILVKGPWNAEFKREFQYFPKSKYMDQVDATSGMFNGLVRRRKAVGAF
jgi:predicted phage terminase large subunit-like protein